MSAEDRNGLVHSGEARVGGNEVEHWGEEVIEGPLLRGAVNMCDPAVAPVETDIHCVLQ